MRKRRRLHQSILAGDFFNVRSPSKAQVQLAQAVIDGFLLGYDGWVLWEYFGRRTRTMMDESRLSGWRTELARRYLHVTDLHAEIRAAFYRDVGFGYDAHREFEADWYRRFHRPDGAATVGLRFRGPGAGNGKRSQPLAARFKANLMLVENQAQATCEGQRAVGSRVSFGQFQRSMSGGSESNESRRRFSSGLPTSVADHSSIIGDEMPPGLVPARSNRPSLDEGWLIEMDSTQRRSLYRFSLPSPAARNRSS